MKIFLFVSPLTLWDVVPTPGVPVMSMFGIFGFAMVNENSRETMSVAVLLANKYWLALAAVLLAIKYWSQKVRFHLLANNIDFATESKIEWKLGL